MPGGTRLVGPVPAKLPVGIDFLARPFGEPTLFKIASAYEAATRHRVSPAEFGPLDRRETEHADNGVNDDSRCPDPFCQRP